MLHLSASGEVGKILDAPPVADRGEAGGVNGSSPNSRKTRPAVAVDRVHKKGNLCTPATTVSSTRAFAGIDISKGKLDRHLWPTGTDASFDNSPAGIDKLIRRMSKQPVRLIVIEATSRCEPRVT